MVFGIIPERAFHSSSVTLIIHWIYHTETSQWQWMSGWQGAFKEKENYLPVPDAPLCAVPAVAGALGAFTFAKVLGRKSTVAIVRVQVFWGWDAVSSRIFLNRYFCSILFVQKLGKKSGVFFFYFWLDFVSWVSVDSSALPQWPSSSMPVRCERCCWHKQRLKLPQLISQTPL